MDRRISFKKKGQEAEVQCGRHRCRKRNSTLPILGQQNQKKKTHATNLHGVAGSIGVFHELWQLSGNFSMG
jgi:hypothetical protein